MEFDFVIVGSGAAGCVLANRLSADPNVTVGLLEAGAGDTHPLIHMPKGIGKVLSNPSYLWAYPTEPEAGTAMKSEIWVRGKVLGGSTSINGMMYVRGQPADFDALAESTSEDWSWQHIGAAYAAIENHELGAGETRGGAGPLKVSLPTCRTPFTDAMVEAGALLGWPVKSDVNQPDNGEAIGYAPRTIYRGRRQSAAVAFLRPIKKRKNLTILTGTNVDTVVFDGQRATGVSVLRAGRAEIILARREVILAGGAMASPGILERSGIGDPERLAALGIPLVVANPSVGENLLEQRALVLRWRLRKPISQNPQFYGFGLLRSLLQYWLFRDGPLTCASMEIGAWFKSRPGQNRPDAQTLIAPFSFANDQGRIAVERVPGMCAVVHPLRATSRGRIHITSRDANAAPKLEPKHRETEEDRAVMVAGIRMLRRYADQPPLRDLIAAETMPGPGVESDAELLAAYDQHGTCGYHTVGTCRMGRDAESVVDPELKVRGVDGLRIMDTSIMPAITAGNTNAPTMAMAWRAAEIIQRSYRRPHA